MSIDRAAHMIEALAPRAAPVAWRDQLIEDEARWFLQAVDNDIVGFATCPPDCPRFRKWGVAGPDHSVTPSGHGRHLYSNPTAEASTRSFAPTTPR
jgi:hypothetical protein